MMDYVKPLGVVESMLAGGAYKLNVPPRHLVIRGMLAGAYLGIATSMAVGVAVETGSWIAGSLLFPFGLALAILLGTEIITGSFALLPCAAVDNKGAVGLRRILANWGWVFSRESSRVNAVRTPLRPLHHHGLGQTPCPRSAQNSWPSPTPKQTTTPPMAEPACSPSSPKPCSAIGW
jgi:hypothetical protein